MAFETSRANRELGAAIGLLQHVISRVRGLPTFLFSYISEFVPKGLYARAILIIITPIVMLEGVIAYVFMESHWQAVTRRLSEATARDIAAIVELYKTYERNDDYRQLTDLARDQLAILVQVLPAGELPRDQPKPFFSLLDKTLSNEIREVLRDQPFWIDTIGRSKHVEIRVQTSDAILRFITRRSQTYASNSHIFLIWMVGTSAVLITVSILFLRNQIRPILRLAEAAEAFGRGRVTSLSDLKPRGAREVRQATVAFLEMQDRISQHVEQRTKMLAGVSHDLRTVLTRFKLQLAFLEEGPEQKSLLRDVHDMEHMLEDYLAFTRGDGGEQPSATDLVALAREVVDEAQRVGHTIELRVRTRRRDLLADVKRQALKRALTNLISNACRYGSTVLVRVTSQRRSIRIDIEDDGPGIPLEERENVFKPFYRIDHARNQEQGNSGLGLAIARDITRAHGGEITLSSSTLGGLRASIRLPT
ncbi:MAG: ATP-binding protein [Hyphomicrobiaceae bacterium]